MQVSPVQNYKFEFKIGDTPYNFVVQADTKAQAFATLKKNLQYCIEQLDKNAPNEKE